MKRTRFAATIALLAPLILMGVRISEARAQVRGAGGSRPAGALPNMAAANFMRGQVVRFNPQANTMTLRTGSGAEAREREFRLDRDSRFFGPDRRAISDLARFEGFRTGANVWFQNGTGQRGDFIRDLRMFDPDEPLMKGRFERGSIVSVDRPNGVITIRSGEGAEARDRRFRINRETRFFDRERLALEEGLGFTGFTTGAPVWFTPGTGANAEVLSDVSLANPVTAAETGPAPASGSPPRYARGVLVKVDPKGGLVTMAMGDTSDERQYSMSMAFDARYFGADTRPLSAGLAFRGFRPGADVWFQTSTGDLGGNITTLSLFDPMILWEAQVASAPAGPEPRPVVSKYVVGKVVAIDVNDQLITVQSGAGDDAREHTYKVVLDTLFFGPQRQPLPEGLRFAGLKPGVEVWLRVGTGEQANEVRDLRMYDPARTEK